MNKLQISHTTTSTDGRYNRQHQSFATCYMYGVSRLTGTNMMEVDDNDIYTGEFVDKTHYENGDFHSKPTFHFLKRKSKDTYVFLKDYKPKITEIISRLGRLEFQFGHLRKNKRKEDKEWRRRIGEREKLLNERIEKLEEQMLNVLNPPLTPELKNPFD